MKSWLNSGKPFAVTVGITEQFYDFSDYTLASTSVYPYNSNIGSDIGDHALEVVGYGTLNGVNFWKVKNSWGTSWGHNGYLMIEQGFGNIEDIACTPVNVCPSAAPAPVFESQSLQKSKGAFSLQSPTAPSRAPGGTQAAELSDPLVVEAAVFAAESLLALPLSQGGFACLPNVNGTFQPTGSDAEAAQVHVQLFSGDQQIVGGLVIHVIFAFQTTDARCTGASGSFDATVHVTPAGQLNLINVHPSTASFVSGNPLNVAAVAGGSATAFAVVALVCALGGRRWYRTRMKYKQLKSVHKEVIRRVTLLENDRNTDHEAVRSARLTQILNSGPPDDWDEFLPAITSAPAVVEAATAPLVAMSNPMPAAESPPSAVAVAVEGAASP